MIVRLRYKNNNYIYNFKCDKNIKLGWYYFPHYHSFIKVLEINTKNNYKGNIKNIKSFGRLLFLEKEV